MTTPKAMLFSFNTLSSSALIALFTSLLLLVGCKSAENAKEGDAADSPLAQGVAESSSALVVEVDGSALRQDELDRQVGYALSSQQMGGVPPQALGEDMVKQIRSEIIERFIAQHVLLSEADRQGVVADNADIEAAVSEITSGLPQGMVLADALEGYNMDEAQFREELKKDIRIRALLDAQTLDAEQASDDDIKAFYDESQQYFQVPASAHTRHILLECAEDASEEIHEQKKREAEALRTQLIDGADFAELAAAQSNCPSAGQGGDLGELTRGQTVAPFEEAAFSQELNKPGPVVKTRFGYHIIEVLKRTDAHTRPLAEVRDNIARFLTDQKRQEAIEQYIQNLKGQSTIRYGDESVR